MPTSNSSLPPGQDTGDKKARFRSFFESISVDFGRSGGASCTFPEFAGSRRNANMHPAMWKHELRHREIAPTTSAHLFKDPPDPGASESLDGVIFAFFHLGLIPCGAVHLDDGDRLASMNHIWSDRVAVQVLNGLDCNR